MMRQPSPQGKTVVLGCSPSEDRTPARAPGPHPRPRKTSAATGNSLSPRPAFGGRACTPPTRSSALAKQIEPGRLRFRKSLSCSYGGPGIRTPMGFRPAVFKTAALPVRTSPPESGSQRTPERIKYGPSAYRTEPRPRGRWPSGVDGDRPRPRGDPRLTSMLGEADIAPAAARHGGRGSPPASSFAWEVSLSVCAVAGLPPPTL